MWVNRKRIAELEAQVAQANRDRDEAQNAYLQESTNLAVTLEQIRSARAITEIGRRSVNPLTMTYQHLTNIALILDGKEPL